MREFKRLQVAAMLFGLPTVISACSALTVVKDGKVLIGGNADMPYVDGLKLRTTPPQDGLFGRMCISREVVTGWSEFGFLCMNDQGLAIAHANAPEGNNSHDPDKPQIKHNFDELVVSQAATVKQAVTLIRSYTFPPGFESGFHLMLADAGGDAAIVEWVEGEMKVIRRDGPTLLMANSLISKPETAGGPNSRYNRGTRMLPQTNASAASVFSVLKEISVGAVIRGQEIGTLYTGVWDVTAGEFHLVYKRDYDHPRTFKLSDELAKGAHSVHLKALFPSPVAFEKGWRDENGPVVRKTTLK
jgi:hypothetical protein